MRWAMMLSTGLVLASSAALWAQQAQSPAATAHPELWPSAHSPAAISDPATERKIDALIARMTIAQKVGQIIQGDITSVTPADLARYPLGSILAGGNSGVNGNERASAAEWARMVASYRTASLQPGANGVAIPILFGVDAVHGHNNLPGATIFPHNIGLGAANDPALIRRIGAATAAEVAGTGIEWTFAPTLAVPQDMRWGRTYEGYAGDPALVARYAREMVLGLQGPLAAGRSVASDHIAATTKHFLADGGTDRGKDQGDAKIDERTLITTHAQGYLSAIDAGALTVMISYSSWNGVKHHGNRSLITGVLKGRMGFDGLVVGDWNGHGQVPGCSFTDCAVAINAGIDLLMAPDGWKGLFDSTLRRVQAGEISRERIDDAVRRVLRVKFKLGLFDRDRGGRGDVSAIGARDHLALAREAVAKSLVLLKNNNAVLPIRPGAKVLVAGDGADSIAKQTGGWTVSAQGTDTVRSDFPNGQTIWEGIRDAVSANGGSAVLSPDGRAADKPDVAIVVFGETPYSEFAGDKSTIAYRPEDRSDLALLKRLKASGVSVVAVFLTGRPLFTNAEINVADAFVAAWLPGSQGAGVADVLVAGKSGRPARDFTGRLSFAWPRDARSPIVNPLFPVGYGLSYRDTQSLALLPEAPGIEVAATMNIDNMVAAGRALWPWNLALSDAGGRRPVAGGSTTSPYAFVAARDGARGGGTSLRWSGQGTVETMGPYPDLTRHMDKALVLTLRADATPTGRIALGMDSASLDVTSVFRAARRGATTRLAVPLRCFAAAGANLRHASSRWSIAADRGFAMTLLTARLSPTRGGMGCPPTIAAAR